VKVCLRSVSRRAAFLQPQRFRQNLIETSLSSRPGQFSQPSFNSPSARAVDHQRNSETSNSLIRRTISFHSPDWLIFQASIFFKNQPTFVFTIVEIPRFVIQTEDSQRVVFEDSLPDPAASSSEERKEKPPRW
jgi:hypothetical protein